MQAAPMIFSAWLYPYNGILSVVVPLQWYSQRGCTPTVSMQAAPTPTYGAERVFRDHVKRVALEPADGTHATQTLNLQSIAVARPMSCMQRLAEIIK